MFEVSLDRDYPIRYPKWNRWVVWKSALEPALNGLIELIVYDFCMNDMSFANDNTNFKLIIPISQLFEELEVKRNYPIPPTLHHSS